MTKEELLATLAHTDTGNWLPADEYDERYIDWSMPTHDYAGKENGRKIEVADADGDSVTLEMTWHEIEDLHRRLTALLLTRDER